MKGGTLMFGSLRDSFNQKKRDAENNDFIMESVMDVEEVLPGSDEELDDLIDVESVPDDVYQKLDAALDKIVSDPGYDDDEVEEMLDDEDDDDDIDDAVIDAVISETAANWLDQ